MGLERPCWTRVLMSVCALLFCGGATEVSAQRAQTEVRLELRMQTSRQSAVHEAMPQVRQDVKHDVSPVLREMFGTQHPGATSGVDTPSAGTEEEEMARSSANYGTAETTGRGEGAKEDQPIRPRSAAQTRTPRNV